MMGPFEGLGQASVLFDLWPTEAEWFLVGGPADGDEAQTVASRYQVRCAGFEPNAGFAAWQREHGFPGVLVECALWDEDGASLNLDLPVGATYRSASVCRPPWATDASLEVQERRQVVGRTLDSLSEEVGPFTNAVLWLDVEYAEPRVLAGAEGLLRAGQVLLANVEVMPRMLASMQDLMGRHGLYLERTWNHRGPEDGIDAVFSRRVR